MEDPAIGWVDRRELRNRIAMRPRAKSLSQGVYVCLCPALPICGSEAVNPSTVYIATHRGSLCKEQTTSAALHSGSSVMRAGYLWFSLA